MIIDNAIIDEYFGIASIHFTNGKRTPQNLYTLQLKAIYS